MEAFGAFFYAYMEKNEDWLSVPLGTAEITGKVEIENISLHKFDSINGNNWYEMQIIVHFRTIWGNDVKITHSTKLRHRLTLSEVENLQEKGIIKINIDDYKKYLKNLK